MAPPWRLVFINFFLLSEPGFVLAKEMKMNPHLWSKLYQLARARLRVLNLSKNIVGLLVTLGFIIASAVLAFYQIALSGVYFSLS